MFKKSIELNMELIEKAGLSILLICAAAALISIVTPFETIAMLFGFTALAAGCAAAFVKLFYSSVFGSEAYIYMSFPISIKAMMSGKLITAVFWMMASGTVLYAALIIMTGLEYAPYTDMNPVCIMLGDVLSTTNMSDPIYDEAQIMQKASEHSFALITMLSQSIAVCSIFQTGAVMLHLMKPARKKYIKTFLAVITGAAMYELTDNVAQHCRDIIYGFSGNIAGAAASAISGCIVSALIYTAVGIMLLKISILLMEKKYELV